MEQVIPFNQAQGGTTPNLCLDNVTKGYGIPDKYGSAWEAWENTEQHPDRNIPTGLDVPIYYSYTATIDGVTANYGHINVQLANGTVWSDGNIYTSIDAYLANHSPKFVGWGESVNSVKVIEGDNMQPTPKQVGDIYYAMTGTNISQKDLDFYITAPRTVYDLIYALFPATQKERDTITLLENERDTVLYPFVNEIDNDLGLPADAKNLDGARAAIASLKKGNSSGNPTVIVNGTTYVPQS